MTLSRRTFLRAGLVAIGGCAGRPPAAGRTDPRARSEMVSFERDGDLLRGDLFLPVGRGRPVPAVAIVGPFCFVREQAPMEYARRLAARGVAALAFDCRTHGESEGEPRRLESVAEKVRDLERGLTFLESRRDVDANRLGVLGVCQGATVALAVAAEDARVKSVATSASALLVGGGGDFAQRRIERGHRARERYLRDGTVEYVPIVHPTRSDVGLPGRYLYEWYSPWASQSRWENRYAVMSDPDVWGFDVRPYVERLEVPVRMLHSEEAYGPNETRRLFDRVASPVKELEMFEGSAHHTQFYDEPRVLHWAADRAADLFRGV